MQKVLVRNLQPGDRLARAVKMEKSGIILLNGGTLITASHLEYLQRYGMANEECFITDKKRISSSPTVFTLEEKVLLENFRSDIIENIKNENLKETLASTCIALGNLEQAVRQGQQLSLEPVQEASQQLLKHVLSDNNAMLQLAAFKVANEYTFSHSLNVAIYAVNFGRQLGLDLQVLEELALSALLLDIGQMSIPGEILEKPGELTREELGMVKRHTYEGYQRIVNLKGVSNDLLQAVLQHHERLDGSGYPLKLQGKKIHPWARILSIADIYDALTSERGHRDAYLPHETVDHLMAMATQGVIDMNILTLYLKKMPVYPEGCLVKLSSGEEGVIVSSPVGTPLRPVVDVTSPAGVKAGYGQPSPSSSHKRLELINNPTIFITGFVGGRS